MTAPTAPGSLTGTWTTPTSVSLNWSPATDEIGVTGYDVGRDGTLLATVSGTKFSYVDSSAPATTRSYTVAARDAAGNVGPTASAFVGVPDTLPPGAPGTLDASATGPGTAELTWTPATDDVGVANYDVSVGGVVVATVDSLTYVATGLTSAESYAFAVAARDDAGNVGPAVDASMVMPDLVSPSSPAGLAVNSVGKSTISLTWSAATDDVGVVGYQVSRDGVLLATTTTTSFDDGSLTAATQYTYAVAAVDAANNVGPNVTVAATTLEATPPAVVAPVVQLAATGQVGTSTVPVVVSWAASDVSGVSSTELQQSKSGGAWSKVNLPSPAVSAVTLMRAPGYTYAYRVRATDAYGNTSTWARGTTVKLVARQEANASITYKGTWTTASVSSAYGGALRYASSSTASATLTFTGRNVVWVAPLAPNRGKADVYLDGVYVQTVDLYSASSVARSIVFSHSWASSGSHTLQIRVKGTSGRPRVDLDAFLLVA